MRVKVFDYKKKDGAESEREVLVLSSNKEYIDALDFQYLSEEEKKSALEIQKEYEEKLLPLLEKSHRRFSREGMSNITEHKLYE